MIYGKVTVTDTRRDFVTVDGEPTLAEPTVYTVYEGDFNSEAAFVAFVNRVFKQGVLHFDFTVQECRHIENAHMDAMCLHGEPKDITARVREFYAINNR